MVAILVLALTWSVAADAATTRKYKGKTAQGRTITFNVRGNTLTALKFSVTLSCADGSTLTDAEGGFQPIKIRNGRISDDQTGTTDEVVLKARRGSGGKRFSGTITVTDKLSPTVGCGPTKVKFSAKRRSGSKAPSPSPNCDPNYAGACLDPNASDYDCAGGSGNGPKYVQGPIRVVGDDHYGLDADGDGVACE
jgi:hypothetical protein